MDPFAVLGVGRDTPPEAIAGAYRRLAKRWHPDRGGGAEAARRMAEINAAYDILRAGLGVPPPEPEPASPAAAGDRDGARRRPAAAAAWLAPELRRALGPELRRALQDGEDVAFVVPTATWASPEALLAVTDRRLLWLLSDVVANRVRSLRFADIDRVQHRLSWPRRRSAVVHVRSASGRGHSFAELPPGTAAAIARHVAARRSGAPRAVA